MKCDASASQIDDVTVIKSHFSNKALNFIKETWHLSNWTHNFLINFPMENGRVAYWQTPTGRGMYPENDDQLSGVEFYDKSVWHEQQD